MGARSRLSRKRRRMQRARVRRRRSEGLVKARPRCPGCGPALVRDERAELDIWKCPACEKTFLRTGPRWFIELELDAVTTPRQKFAVVEFMRKAA